MKKGIRRLLAALILFSALLFLLNRPVTINQGIDYRDRTIRLPLYLKLLDYFDRHYNYAGLTKRIIGSEKSDLNKAKRIFEWTHRNIRRQPDSLPVVDDHVWHIIVRGYGVRDQSHDVFITLCYYAGLDGFYTWLYSPDGATRIPVSIVQIGGKKVLFDPPNGVFFQDGRGGPASLENIRAGQPWTLSTLDGVPDIDYAAYFRDLPSALERGFSRASLQSPWQRIKSLFRKERRK